ncbi:DUF58 domain-containing protein [Agarivorans sp. DSG3-1]|uniref:DUF58 domain-containing protein n=1 Tax=Agarivorans sp. DSG3-1 TaxID=3342249 RepID=UPI00398E35CE
MVEASNQGLLKPQSHNNDGRIYAQYSRLIKLRGQIGAFSLLPHLKSGSVLSGRHSSKFRGRGLNFEELRHYQQGDDIRNLDWKVTLRTGKPHVRTYTEEKDRSVMLCVDQGSSMFFSSLDTMKSVVAAELAALVAWRSLKDNDRVAWMINGSDGFSSIKPQRAQASLLAALERLSQHNQALSAHSKDIQTSSLSASLQQLMRLKLKDNIIVILSDWQHTSEQELSQFKYLQQHNDVLAVLISDPMEYAVPSQSKDWVLSDGQSQINLQGAAKLAKANQQLAKQGELKHSQLKQLMALKNLPLIEVDTSGEHISQFCKSLGGFK